MPDFLSPIYMNSDLRDLWSKRNIKGNWIPCTGAGGYHVLTRNKGRDEGLLQAVYGDDLERPITGFW